MWIFVSDLNLTERQEFILRELHLLLKNKSTHEDRLHHDYQLIDTLEGLAVRLAGRTGTQISRDEVGDARSIARTPEFIAERGWTVTYVGVGTQGGIWGIADRKSPLSAERSINYRRREVLDSLRRHEAASKLQLEALLTTRPDEKQRIVAVEAELKTTQAMLAIANMGWGED
jgi:hypothetical protein